MALLTITGYPCSGKTRRVEQLKAFFASQLGAEPAYKIVHLSDDALHVPRSVYDDGRLEKPARQTLFTAVQRALAPDALVIVDGMNYIKGFRYQMYCQAREHRLRRCTVSHAPNP